MRLKCQTSSILEHQVVCIQKIFLILTSWINGSPTCDPHHVTVECASLCSQTDWLDVISEVHRWGETQQSHVIVMSVSIAIAWMNYESRDVSGHLVWIGLFLRLSPQVHSNACSISPASRTWPSDYNHDYSSRRSKHVIEDLCVGYPGKQWAADRTHWLLISDPPQKWLPSAWRLTCHGQAPPDALTPPTIFVLRGALPHASKKKRDKGPLFWRSQKKSEYVAQ